jgi:hypothetical protein
LLLEVISQILIFAIIKIKDYPSKRGIFVTDSLVSAWQVLWIPKYLQIDNGLSFKGSNRHP